MRIFTKIPLTGNRITGDKVVGLHVVSLSTDLNENVPLGAELRQNKYFELNVEPLITNKRNEPCSVVSVYDSAC